MKEKLTIVGVVVAIGIGVLGILTGSKTPEVYVQIPNGSGEQVGALSSPIINQYVRLAGGATIGGGRTATSTTGSVVPLLATDFDTENLIDVTLNVVDGTLSFPASSTIRELPNAGDSKVIFIRNASTTATMDLTITGGTGVLQKNATTTNIVAGDTDGSNFAQVTLIRKANTDFEALVDIFVDD